MNDQLVAYVPFSIVAWQWAGLLMRRRQVDLDVPELDFRSGSELRSYNRSSRTSENNFWFQHETTKAESTIGPIYRTADIFQQVKDDAAAIFPEAFCVQSSPKLFLGPFHPFNSSVSSPYLGRSSLSYFVVLPHAFLDESNAVKRFIFAHEIGHYCLRRTWHHTFPAVLFFAATAFATLIVFLPSSTNFGVISSWIAGWITAVVLRPLVARHAERRADDAAVRICLFSCLYRRNIYSLDKVLADVFAAFLPKEMRDPAGHHIQEVIWFSPESYMDSHPSPSKRIKEVRKIADRLLQTSKVLWEELRAMRLTHYELRQKLGIILRKP